MSKAPLPAAGRLSPPVLWINLHRWREHNPPAAAYNMAVRAALPGRREPVTDYHYLPVPRDDGRVVSPKTLRDAGVPAKDVIKAICLNPGVTASKHMLRAAAEVVSELGVLSELPGDDIETVQGLIRRLVRLTGPAALWQSCEDVSKMYHASLQDLAWNQCLNVIINYMEGEV